MITVTYDGKETLEVSGHAFAGKKGQDLVCAAATALAMTLGENAEKTSFQPGFCRCCQGNPEVFRAIFRGFLLLQELFPWALQCVNK